MTPSLNRRLEALERHSPAQTFILTDPATGEVAGLEILEWLDSGEIALARAVRSAQIGVEIEQEGPGRIRPEGLAAIATAPADDLDRYWRQLVTAAFARRRREPDRWKLALDREPAPWPIQVDGAA